MDLGAAPLADVPIMCRPHRQLSPLVKHPGRQVQSLISGQQMAS
jgi:hypothetical protein